MDNKKRRELISERLDKEEKFNSCKSYNALWKKIQKNLEEEGIFVTFSQVMNKWKNLKKRYKEVVDNNSKTGKEKCTWKHLKTFSVWK